MSITGCRLEIGLSQNFFYRQPTRQASTECTLPALKQLNFWMQISSQLSRFPNSNNDHCDLDFRLTVCDVVRRPCRGHEAASEDSMLKRGGGVCGPPMALVWGGRMNQLLVQVEEEVPGHVGWMGKVQLKCGDGRKLLITCPFLWGVPLSEGRALIAYLIGRGLKPFWEVWWFSPPLWCS